MLKAIALFQPDSVCTREGWGWVAGVRGVCYAATSWPTRGQTLSNTLAAEMRPRRFLSTLLAVRPFKYIAIACWGRGRDGRWRVEG